MRGAARWAAVVAVLLSSASCLQAAGIGNTAAVFLSRPSVEVPSEHTFYAGVTQRVVLKGSNFNTDSTQLFFDHPDWISFEFRVVSPTRIVLFVKNSFSFQRRGETLKLVLKLVAVDTGAGAVQLNREGGGVVIGKLSTKRRENSRRKSEARKVGTPPLSTPSVRAVSPKFTYHSDHPLMVTGNNFGLEYTELYFSPPLPEEAIAEYEIQQSNIIRINLRDEYAEPGLLRVAAIDNGGGLVHLNPKEGGVVVASIAPPLTSNDITVNDNKTLYIYQSTKQFHITGSGFQDNMKVLFGYGLCGGETRSVVHTKLGERPGQLTVELAEGTTWMPNGNKAPQLPAPQLPAALELRSANAGKGWAQIGPPGDPTSSRTVAVVFADPTVDASDTEIYRGHTVGLVISGTGFPSSQVKIGDKWTDITTSPVVYFDPPINPELVDVEVHTSRYMTVSAPSSSGQVQWAPVGYFGPLKVKGVDTGAGKVMLDRPVTVANVVPGSPFDFFMSERLHQLEEEDTLKRHQDRVDQAAHEWDTMMLAEREKATAAAIPSPSVKASSKEIYATETVGFEVDVHNFLPEMRLVFDPPLQDMAFGQMVRNSTKIVLAQARDSSRVPFHTRWRAEPRAMKAVAIDTGSGLVPLNPEEGGVVVAVVRDDITISEDEGLLVYQSTKQIRIAGRGFDDDIKVNFRRHWGEKEADFSVTATKPDQLTLNLAEGSTWIEKPDSLPRALLVRGVEARAGPVNFQLDSDFDDVQELLTARKVATVFEDPTVQASDTKVYSGVAHQGGGTYGTDHEIIVYGTGFNRVVKPILDFDPPLAAAAVDVHVVNRTTIRLGLSTALACQSRAQCLGPLKVKGVDTGAGMVVFDSPVTIAIMVDVDEPNGEAAEGAAAIVEGTSVKASSQDLYMYLTNNGILLKGTNFNLKPKFYFDSLVPEELELQQKFISSTEILISRAISHDTPPVPWRVEPGQLKVVAIDTGPGVVLLNPEDGGVVVANVWAHAVVQDNKSLHIYQSTKEVQVAGAGFNNDTLVEYLGPSFGGDWPWPVGDFDLSVVSSNQLTLSLLGEGSVWIENPDVLPEALSIVLGLGDDSFDWFLFLPGFGTYSSFGGYPATVFEDPSVHASDIQITRTGSPELVIRGTGFNSAARPILDFDPPLDSADLDIKVVSRTMIHLILDTAQHGWVPVEHLGPLKIKGADTGAGMVVFDSPVTVATVVPDITALSNQAIDDGTAPALHEFKEAAESEEEGFREHQTNLQLDTTAALPPSVEASSRVIGMKAADSLVVNGDNFDLSTRLTFDPPLGSGFEMRVFSRTEIDVFTKFVIGGAPRPWREEPGSLRVVAIETDTGSFQLHPEQGGVVVAMVE